MITMLFSRINTNLYQNYAPKVLKLADHLSSFGYGSIRGKKIPTLEELVPWLIYNQKVATDMIWGAAC